MILTAKNIRDIEAEERRVLGAFRLVDGPTGAPLVVPATIAARSAAIIDVTPPGPPAVAQILALGRGAVDVRQNRRGWFVVFAAPLFDAYTRAFREPANPPELPADRRLRVRFAITESGPNHLPRFFDLLLPRSLDANDADSVFVPQPVELLRAPSATIADGWAALRVRVRRNATLDTLPGVLVRVFRRPRAPNAAPIGVGLTEWRDDHLRGDAVVPIPGLLRFTPGAGANVLETTHAIEVEATRDQNFPDPALATPALDQLPDIDALIAGVGATIVRRVSPPGAPAFGMDPAGPLTIAAGEELTLDLTLP